MTTIDVYSDLICPWCFVGKRRLEKAIATLGGVVVKVRWHPFQLNPDMPTAGMDRRVYRSAKFGSWARSQELDADVTRVGREDGVAFNFDKITRTPNTFDSHRVVWLAGERGVQDAVVERLFRAYFTDGRDLSDLTTLAAVAAEGGLVPSEVADLLAGDDGTEVVKGAEQKARSLGVTGVPFVVINGVVAVSGAQSPEVFHRAIAQAAPSASASQGICGLDPTAGKGTC